MLIYRGAEAKLYREKFLGMDSVRKARVKKSYLAPQLDKRLRKSRLRNEARMLSRARAAVSTPHVLFVGEGTIVMEYIPRGETVKNLFLKGKTRCARLIGKEVRKLHNLGIVHNDLTTSNLICSGKKLYFIDFGLAEASESLEDKAVDLVVLKHMMASTHYDVFGRAWPRIMEGYGAETKLLSKMAEIESRAKYR